MKVFKIRNKETGLFSIGGANGDWSKTGKNWNNVGHLKNHINMVNTHHQWREKHNIPYPYVNAEIVEFELVETDKSPFTIDELFKGKK